ncbi:DEAD box ATP-dependent RNA helicase, putative [Metarhizium acridum CQMa 102]|uniref:ATP-dependent RNA helicase n=1 Tax=Metarhizium acridum (strain CQMa 102) TaxID=655827 RepID=E9E8B6_METAQ|nr:DEAD box ATP-dependent RNA helicase, putative [Metarhizium acridum CQMa 102]EFY87866.1 DEAD box ATP-dependent RNA helicase, putative [Metarhizium acridum CQMa 102]
MYARYVPPSKGAKVTAPAEPSAPKSSPAPKSDAIASKLVEEFSYTRYVPGARAVTKSSAPSVSAPKTIQYFDEEAGSTPKRKREPATEEQQGSESKKIKRVKDAIAPRDGTAAVDSKPSAKKKNRRKRKQRTQANDSSDDSDDEPKHTTAMSSVKIQDNVEEPEFLQDKNKTTEEAPPLENVENVENGADSRDRDSDVEMAEAAALEVGEQTKEKKPKREKKKKKKQAKGATEEEDKDDEKDMARHKAVLERKVKSIKLATKVAQTKHDESDEESAELHGLEPLPQPAPVPEDESKPTYDTLPLWLSNPIRVAQDTKAPFTDLGILPRPSRILADKGYNEAFAVQTAAIPLLLPTSKHRPGDLLVSAATGSGKTLAYALPIVRDISNGVVTRLRALVVLPTRELVKQAQDVFEVCAKAYEGEDRKRVRIGVAIGSQSIKSEQEAIIERESRYDPDAYSKIQEEQRQQRANTFSADVDDTHDLDSPNTDVRLGPWKGEVVDFSSRVDVLICTPGRLVEHIEQTPGFSLDYIRWLVVDEADKLLAQSFQGWLDLVLEKFRVNKFSARDFPDMAYSGVRKVILSATLTRDLSLLNQLALRRPRLIVLENDGAVQVAEHTLPVGLREFAVRVHEANLKPLYLLDLLRQSHMTSHLGNGDSSSTLKADEDASDSSDTSSDSDSSDSDSDSDSDTTSDSDTSDEESTTPASKTQIPISLIFTKSNESALRLSRLLTLLDASLTGQISTLTSTTPTHIRRKVLRAFTTPSSPVRLIIASDLVARGIDIPKLGHVINYDLPASVAGYVHRVGRTARAGRSGCAWTLIGDDESGWFWGKIAKNQAIRRTQKVERTRVEEMTEDRVQAYEAALAILGKEALELRRSK